MSARGTSNTNSRGNTKQRAARKQQVLEEHGDGTFAECSFGCGTVLDWFTVTLDRIFPGVFGGTYDPCNLKPACIRCNSLAGSALRDRIKRDGFDHVRELTMLELGLL